MSDSIECSNPNYDPPEVLIQKLNSMLHEGVRVVRDGEEKPVRGILQTNTPNVWEVRGRNDSYARFSVKNVVWICPYLIHIKIKPLQHELSNAPD